MTIEYAIIEEKQLVLVKGSGIITGEDVIRHLDVLASDNRYIAPMKKIIDYRFIESLNISQDEAVSIALKKDTFSNKFRGEKCVFISPTNGTYGSSREHQSLVDSSNIDTAVFRNIEKALNWLDITLDNSHEDWLKEPE
jgi:hypothetical protein